VSVFNQLNLF